MSLDALNGVLSRGTSMQSGTGPLQDVAPAAVVPEGVGGERRGQAGLHVEISPVGKALSLAGGEAAKSRRDEDIDNSSLPDGVKELLKRIRDLNEQIQKKMIELRRIQADQRLNEQERAQALERVQAELNSLNGALTKANAMLLQAMDDAQLDGDARMQVASLLMK